MLQNSYLRAVMRYVFYRELKVVGDCGHRETMDLFVNAQQRDVLVQDATKQKTSTTTLFE